MRISPLRSFQTAEKGRANLHPNRSPRKMPKLTANRIPTLNPKSKHLTKFDSIYNQKSPERTVSKTQAEDIAQRLYSGRSNKGKGVDRKKNYLVMLSKSKIEKEDQECTFRPDTSLTRLKNYKLLSKHGSRSNSRERIRNHLTASQNVASSNKLFLQGLEFKNFNTITEESGKNSRNAKCKNGRKMNMFNSLKTSMSHPSLLNYKQLHPPKHARPFNEFYKHQMEYLKKKTEKIQNKLCKKEKIFDEMQKQRERVTHLSEESRRILSTSRDRQRSKERIQLLNSSRSELKNLSATMKSLNDFSFKSVHDRLFAEK